MKWKWKWKLWWEKQFTLLERVKLQIIFSEGRTS